MKYLVRLLIFLAVFLVPLWAKCYLTQTRQLAVATSLLENSDRLHAIPELNKAIRFAAPLMPATKAVNLLNEIALHDQDPLIRRQALLSLKSALIASNQQTRYAQVNLSSVEELIRNSYQAGTSDLLQEFPKPSYQVSYQIGADLSFVAWITCLVFLICKAVRADGGINLRPAFGLLCLSLALLASWLGFLSRA